jgi:hypothetical protein
VQGGGACPALAQRKRGRTFCRHGTNFIKHYACRGTSLIGAGKLSRYRIFVGGTGAVSRYIPIAIRISRSQKFVKVVGFKLRADARFAHRSGAKVGVRVQQPLQICLGCRSKSKNVCQTTYPYCPCYRLLIFFFEFNSCQR